MFRTNKSEIKSIFRNRVGRYRASSLRRGQGEVRGFGDRGAGIVWITNWCVDDGVVFEISQWVSDWVREFCGVEAGHPVGVGVDRQVST